MSVKQARDMYMCMKIGGGVVSLGFSFPPFRRWLKKKKKTSQPKTSPSYENLIFRKVERSQTWARRAAKRLDGPHIVLVVRCTRYV